MCTDNIESFVGDDESDSGRAKSAPSKRKSWVHKSVELRAAEGEPVYVEAPGKRATPC